MRFVSKRIKTPLLLLPAACLFLHCIERDNLWDPDNGCHPYIELPAIQQQYRDQIKVVVKNAKDSTKTCTEKYLAEFDNTYLKNSSDLAENLVRLNSSSRIAAENSAIEEENSKLDDCTSAKPKLFLSPSSPAEIFPNPGSITHLSAWKNTLEHERDSIRNIIDEANATCSKQVVLGKSYSDSIIDIYRSLITSTSDKLDSLNDFKQFWQGQQDAIQTLREKDSLTDIETRLYNDSIVFCKQKIIDDPDSVDHRLKNLQPGDTLAIGVPEIELKEIFFENVSSAGMKEIVILGNPTTMTEIKGANRVQISGSSNITFSNLIFSDTKDGIGARITENSFNIRFRNCRFVHNKKYGLYADYSRDLFFDTCMVMLNGSDSTDQCGGIRFVQLTGKIIATNILDARNKGDGINILSSPVDFYNCTIADNTSYGIKYSGSSSQGTVTFFKSLFCYNGKYGVWRNKENSTIDLYVLGDWSNRFWMNEEGEVGGSATIIAENKPFIIGNPDFVDRENDDIYYDDYHFGENGTLIGRNIGYQY